MLSFLSRVVLFVSLAAGLAASSVQELVAPKTPKTLWTLDLKSASYGSGAIGDLKGDGNLAIVFGTYYNDEHLYCVNAADGKLLWKFKSEGGPFDASIALADLDGDNKLKILAADSSTGALFCLDADGKPVWKHKLPNSTDSPPAVADLAGDGKLVIVVGTMMLGDKHGRVVALEAKTQQVMWTARVPGHIQSEPALVDLDGDGVLDVVVTTWMGDKSVHALNGKDGKEMWRFAMKGDSYHGVSVIAKPELRLVAASTKGDVHLLGRDGKAVWTKETGEYLFGPTTVGDLDGDGIPEIIVPGSRIHVFGLDGKEKWTSKEFGSIPRGVALADADGDGLPDLFFGAADRRFRVHRGKDGGLLWHFDATVKGEVYEQIDSAPLLADFGRNGGLRAFFVAGKGTSDKTKPHNYGRAYAVQFGQGKAWWPTFRGNLKRTGSAPE